MGYSSEGLDRAAAPVVEAPESKFARRWTARLLYPIVVSILSALVIWGFWPTYFGPLLSGDVGRPFIVHLHGAVFTGWLMLLMTQALLAASGRIDLHRRIGTVGIAYGVLVLAIVSIISVTGPLARMHSGEWTLEQAAGWLIIPISDLVLFAGFFTAAIVYRSSSVLHKRLMLAATVALADAGVARLSFAQPQESPGVFLLLALDQATIEGVSGQATYRHEFSSVL